MSKYVNFANSCFNLGKATQNRIKSKQVFLNSTTFIETFFCKTYIFWDFSGFSYFFLILYNNIYFIYIVYIYIYIYIYIYLIIIYYYVYYFIHQIKSIFTIFIHLKIKLFYLKMLCIFCHEEVNDYSIIV